ncbi:hypothetical protein ICW40_07780, partial [Actinotalea ferrariae]|nr:hypothetical protein [Actinotalea ferrariae]
RGTDGGPDGLARRLRTLAVPAALLVGDELAAFAGTTPPLRDAAPELEAPDGDVPEDGADREHGEG